MKQRYFVRMTKSINRYTAGMQVCLEQAEYDVLKRENALVDDDSVDAEGRPKKPAKKDA